LKEIFKRQGLDPEHDATWVVNRGSTRQQLQMGKQGEADAVSGLPPASYSPSGWACIKYL
jgi:hypothetical protein